MFLPSIVEVTRMMATPSMLQTFITVVSIRHFRALKDDEPVGVDLDLTHRVGFYRIRPKRCLRHFTYEIDLAGSCAAVDVLGTLELAYQRLMLGWQ